MKTKILFVILMLGMSCAVFAQTGTARKTDEYGKIKPVDEQARLDNYAIALQMDPNDQGYIIAYAGRSTVKGEAQKRLDFAKAYLTNKRGLDAQRIVTVDGGYREEATTELWAVPSGATPPMASPTVEPSEVVMKKVVKKRAPVKRK